MENSKITITVKIITEDEKPDKVLYFAVVGANTVGQNHRLGVRLSKSVYVDIMASAIVTRKSIQMLPFWTQRKALFFSKFELANVPDFPEKIKNKLKL